MGAFLRRLACSRGYLAVLLLLFVGHWLMPSDGDAPKVFARVHGQEVQGYAYFAGGVRAADVPWQATMGTRTLAQGRTDASGTYAFQTPNEVSEDVVITVQMNEDQLAHETVPAARFAPKEPREGRPLGQ